MHFLGFSQDSDFESLNFPPNPPPNSVGKKNATSGIPIRLYSLVAPENRPGPRKRSYANHPFFRGELWKNFGGVCHDFPKAPWCSTCIGCSGHDLAGAKLQQLNRLCWHLYFISFEIYSNINILINMDGAFFFCGTGINKIWCGSVCQRLFGNMFYPWYPRPKYTNPFFNCCYQVQPALHLGCLKLSLFQIIGYHLKKFVGFLSVGRNPGFAPVDMKNINQKHSGTWHFWWKKNIFY